MQSDFQTDDKLQVAKIAPGEAGRRGRRSKAPLTGNGAGSGNHQLSEVMSTPAEGSHLKPLEVGILQAVSYADVFDFPLTAGEIHHNLVGIAATEDEVQTVLSGTRLVPRYLERHDNYHTLPGRGETVVKRRQRATASAELWPWAIHYGRMIARLPFVRMVAVTGALAVNNAKPKDDIDYLIVTEAGRLWSSRALVILLVKRAARRGIIVCPNYFLSERALALPERDLFTAHELLQMAPIASAGMYKRLLALNPWAAGYLPNAWAKTAFNGLIPAGDNPGKRLLERLMRLPPGDWLERWEMSRKIAKFSSLYAQPSAGPPGQSEGAPPQKATRQDLVEVSFSADRCKGHFHSHGRQTLDAYSAQLAQWATEERFDS